MKEIIFWFSNSKKMNYWLRYTINYCEKLGLEFKANTARCWIDLLFLKISFKANVNGDADLAGRWDMNQYWVEDLFDNNFEEFFKLLIKENING